MPCPFHPSRLRNVAKKYHKEMADKIKVAFDNEIKMQELEADLREKGYSKAADTIDRFKFSLWNYRSFPAGHWRRIRTTNTMLQLSLSNLTQPVVQVQVKGISRASLNRLNQKQHACSKPGGLRGFA